MIEKVKGEDHLGLLKKVVGSMYRPGTVEYDDMYQYGALGLMDAVEKYDPNRDVAFNTYAQWRIRGAVLDGLRKELKRGFMGGGVQLRGKLLPFDVFSLDAPVIDEEDVDTWGDLVGNDGLEDRYINYELVSGGLNQLSIKSKVITLLYFEFSYTNREIAEMYRVTESRICQILQQAKQELYGYLKEEYEG